MIKVMDDGVDQNEIKKQNDDYRSDDRTMDEHMKRRSKQIEIE